AELGVLVHLARADLHLDALALWSDDRRVDGAIEVAFGRGDIVVEFPRDVGPEAMDHSQRGVTVTDRPDDDAHRPDVEELLERQLLALHLAVDAVHVFRPAVDLRLNARGLKLGVQPPAELLDVALAIGTPLVEGGRDPPVLLRL